MMQNINIQSLTVGDLATNCYILLAQDIAEEAVLVDPGDEAQRIARILQQKPLKKLQIVLTHGHIDHIAAIDRIREIFSDIHVTVAIHQYDRDMLTDASCNLSYYMGNPQTFLRADRFLKEHDEIVLGSVSFTVLHVPGHSKGSVAFYSADEQVLFAGDCLFAQSIGRTDLPGGNQKQMNTSLQKLCQLPKATHVFSGHGPAAILQDIFKQNPYVHGF